MEPCGTTWDVDAIEAHAVARASGVIQLPTVILLERFHLIFVVALS